MLTFTSVMTVKVVAWILCFKKAGVYTVEDLFLRIQLSMKCNVCSEMDLILEVGEAFGL